MKIGVHIIQFKIIYRGFKTSLLVNERELIMVHSLFRHGERTTERFYPTDPYKDEKFFPIGLGNLTNRGKMQAYELGKFFRGRYNSFLGPYYTDKIIKIRSTVFNRTRSSAALVLAGLWSPKDIQIWHEHLPWIPIPVDYKEYAEDDLLNVDLCPRRIQLLEEQIKLPEVQKKYMDPYRDLICYIEKRSGLEIKTLHDLLKLYAIFQTETEASNLILPKWTKGIYPDKIYEPASLSFNCVNYNPEVKRINTGYFLKKVIDDCKDKIGCKFEENENKIMLYSAHETTIALLLDALGCEPHIPNFSSAVIIELYKSNDDYIIKMIYRRESFGDRTEDICLPGGVTSCTLEEFEEKLCDVLPTVPFKEAAERR